ncbi:MAG TPA: hypothetical protein VL122_07365 [Nitrospirota bacterium]|nr:hypothetical protein [Nitrospirota bacterium]
MAAPQGYIGVNYQGAEGPDNILIAAKAAFKLILSQRAFDGQNNCEGFFEIRVLFATVQT